MKEEWEKVAGLTLAGVDQHKIFKIRSRPKLVKTTIFSRRNGV
jgi:hypothetical protein